MDRYNGLSAGVQSRLDPCLQRMNERTILAAENWHKESNQRLFPHRFRNRQRKDKSNEYGRRGPVFFVSFNSTMTLLVDWHKGHSVHKKPESLIPRGSLWEKWKNQEEPAIKLTWKMEEVVVAKNLFTWTNLTNLFNATNISESIMLRTAERKKIKIFKTGTEACIKLEYCWVQPYEQNSNKTR